MIDIVRRAIVDEYRPQSFTFSRNSLAYDDYGRLYYPHQLRYVLVDGRAGVLVEEGTTNLLGTKGEFEVDSDSNGIADGWSLFISTDLRGLVQYELSSSEKWQGAKSQRFFWSGTFENTTDSDRIHFFTDVTGLNENTTYTFSVWLKSPVQSGVSAALHIREGGEWTVITSKDISITDEWQRFEVTVTTPASITSLRLDITVGVHTSGGQTDLDLYIDGAQLEAKNYATSWITTTRAAEMLTVPTAGVLDPQEGTVEVWAYINPPRLLGETVFWHTTNALSPFPRPNSIRIYRDTSYAKWMGLLSDASMNYTLLDGVDLTPGWHYFALRWSTAEAAFFVDGVKRGTATSPKLPQALDSVCYLGHGSDPGQYFRTNGLVGPVRISRRARTDQEIADAYAAGTLTADADTTLLLDFSKGPYVRRAAKVIRAV